MDISIFLAIGLIDTKKILENFIFYKGLGDNLMAKCTSDNGALDRTDKSILNTLLRNARASHREIAAAAGVSAVTTLKRVKRLEQQGIIRGYTLAMDYEEAGYDIGVVIRMRISKGKLLDVEKKIAVERSVSAVYDITGDSDAIVIAKFRNRRSMDRFLKKIQAYDFVERTETSLILNTLKEESIPVD